MMLLADRMLSHRFFCHLYVYVGITHSVTPALAFQHFPLPSV